MSNHNSCLCVIEQRATDRRMRMERRGADIGPPAGIRERRQGQERRAISVSEVRLSDAEWAQYFAQKPLP